MNDQQLTLDDTGELAPQETFAITANRQKTFGIIRKAPWDSWQMSRVAKFIKFTESYVIAPVVRIPMVLHGYQREMYECWLDPTTRQDMRKIARGNAKTTTTAAFGTAAAFLGQDEDIPIVATTVKQAEKTVYGQMLSMVDHPAGKRAPSSAPTGHPELGARVQVFTSVADKRILIAQTNSAAYPMADLPGPLQGLNPSIAILDEASEATSDTWGALVDAGGKRPQSIAIGISTPSFRLEGNALMDFEEAYKAGIQTPGVSWGEFTAPIDCDHRDERNWYLANPGLSTVPPILHIDALRSAIGMSGEQRFRCYRLAQWPTMALEGWLGEDGPEVWNSLESGFRPIRGARTWAGVDVSLHHDSTAIVYLQQWPDSNRVHAWAELFYPDSGVVDQAFVKEALRKASVDYSLAGVAYDPRFFEAVAQDLDAEGIPMIEVPQTATRMVPAVAAAYRLIVGRLLSHDGDAAFGRQVVNAKARPSEGGITLSKSPKTRGLLKCDAAIGLCLAALLLEQDRGEISDDQLKEWFANAS